MPLHDLCQRNVVTINPQASVVEAARLMKEKHVGDLIVIDAHEYPPRPIGIVTDRDIVTMVVAADIATESVTVSDIMARRLATARVEDDLQDVTRKMREAGVRRMPIVDDHGSLVGIVSIDDIYQRLSAELRNLASVSAFQVLKERSGGTILSRL